MSSQTSQMLHLLFMKKIFKLRKTSLRPVPWQLQTAKARFSELFRKARAEGPQWVTRQGKDAVVVVAAEEFQRLRARSRQPESLVEFFAKSPLAGANLKLDRPRDYGREIDL